MTSPCRRVLVVSYYYPPYGSVGGTRVSKMTRYLADHGWDATVLTVAGDDRPEELEVEIDPGSIHRVAQLFDVMAGPRLLLGRRNIEGQRFAAHQGWKASALWHIGLAYRNVACFPDPQIGWFRPAVQEGLRLIERIRPHVILSSSFPNTSHLVARRLAAESRLPWVAELRDLWTDNHNFRRVAPLRALERRLEHHVLTQADALVTVSDVWARLLSERFDKEVHVVPNGFDPLDYGTPPPGRPGLFTLVYTGMFYKGKQNPAPLLHAIAALGRSGVISPETFRLELVGYYLGPILSLADELGVRPYVTADPPVPYLESLKRQAGATALLFLDWADGSKSGWYSAKIYEYLGAGRPILSVGPHDSVVASLLEETNAGVVAASASEAERTLLGWLEEFRATGLLARRSDVTAFERFYRQSAARQMAAILDKVVADRREGSPT